MRLRHCSNCSNVTARAVAVGRLELRERRLIELEPGEPAVVVEVGRRERFLRYTRDFSTLQVDVVVGAQEIEEHHLALPPLDAQVVDETIARSRRLEK